MATSNAKKVSKWYMAGLWNDAMVDEAVEKGFLTEAEATKIKKLPVKV